MENVILIILLLIFVFYSIKLISRYLILFRNLKQSYVSVVEYVNLFEQLCNPTRCFSNAEKMDFIEKTSSVVLLIRKISTVLMLAKKRQDVQMYEKLMDYFFNIDNYQQKNNQINKSIHNVQNNFKNCVECSKLINDTNFYQSHHSIDRYIKLCQPVVDSIQLLCNENSIKFVSEFDSVTDFPDMFYQTIDAVTIKNHNDEFVSNAKKSNKLFFDNCLEYPLDNQQQDAILNLEDNTLVISSAGSGKTSTIVGKTRYLVDIEHIDPKKILIITYTKKAANELLDRIGYDGPSCMTFHALAVKIIAEVTNDKPTICDPNLMLNCFYKLLAGDTSFQDSINKYVLHYRSLMKLEHYYDTAAEYYEDRKKYGIQTIYKDMDGNLIFTKSEEERQICDWLTLHNISFKYEQPYEHSTSSNEYKQYRPDFSIYHKDEQGVEERIYLEHFAIDKDGRVPFWFGTDYNNAKQSGYDIAKRWEKANFEYNEGIKWKVNLHNMKGTCLIYTTSAMFHNETIWSELERKLNENGVKVKSLSPKELFSQLIKREKGLEHSVFKLLEQFTVLLKTNLIDLNTLISHANDIKDVRSLFIIEKLIKPFIQNYNEELQGNQMIDFNDAITTAAHLCKEGKWCDYDYILIDEFQDISRDRYDFIQSLRKDTPNCFTKLFCVGDDWQSIYRFSGSDMTLFYDFEKYFGYTKHCKIETTYRFFEPLIGISSKFIQANPAQQKKNIVTKSNKSTTLELLSYFDNDDERNKVEGLIKLIPNDETILIIGRYNYDAGSLGFKFNPQDADKMVIWLNLANRKVRFMSVHSSKGLEADNVILINCNRGVNGFPSLIEDDPVLSFVLSDKDSFLNAEERRLFYVAITRAKKKMYVLYNKNMPSCFVEELQCNKMSNSQYMPCPHCGNGHIVPVKEGKSKYGDWIALSCSNKSSGCPYFRLMKKKDYDAELIDFNNRNSFDSVQANSKKRYQNIREYVQSITVKQPVNQKFNL